MVLSTGRYHRITRSSRRFVCWECSLFRGIALQRRRYGAITNVTMPLVLRDYTVNRLPESRGRKFSEPKASA